MFFQQYYYPYAVPFSPSTCRTAPALHQELASLNNQPMGAAGCQGLQTGADVTYNPKVPASNSGDRGQANSGGRRGTEAAQQRGNKGRQPMPQPVCQQDICGPEEGWFLQTGCQLEAIKSVHGDHTLQDGELAMLKDLLQPGDWMATIDLKDAYLSVTIREQHRKYLCFVWNDQLYEFQCLPFGLCSAPRVFTKLLKPVLARH